MSVAVRNLELVAAPRNCTLFSTLWGSRLTVCPARNVGYIVPYLAVYVNTVRLIFTSSPVTSYRDQTGAAVLPEQSLDPWMSGHHWTNYLSNNYPDTTKDYNQFQYHLQHQITPWCIRVAILTRVELVLIVRQTIVRNRYTIGPKWRAWRGSRPRLDPVDSRMVSPETYKRIIEQAPLFAISESFWLLQGALNWPSRKDLRPHYRFLRGVLKIKLLDVKCIRIEATQATSPHKWRGNLDSNQIGICCSTDPKNGAPVENRTPVFALQRRCSAIKLQGH